MSPSAGELEPYQPRYSLWLKIALPFTVGAAIAIFVVGQISLGQSIDQTKMASQQKLLNIVTMAACALAGDDHDAAMGNSDSAQRYFDYQVGLLRRFRDKLNQIDEFPEHWYTLLANKGDTTTFGLMTHETPFKGDTTIFRSAAARSVFENVWNDQVPRFTDTYTSDNGRWISALAAITNKKGETVGMMQVDLHYERYVAYVEELQTEAHWLQAGGIVFAGLIGVLLGRLIARPIRRVSDAATHIANSGFQGEVAEPRALKLFPDETSSLIRNFNSMAGKLEETLVSLRKANRRLESVDHAKSVFLQFVAHELRTPLNGLGTIKLLPELQDFEEDTLEALHDAGKSVDRLRNFTAAAERYIVALTHEYDVSEVFIVNQTLESVITDLRPYASQHGLEIDLRMTDEILPVAMPYDVLNELFHQVIHNAIKFGHKGDRIEIELVREKNLVDCYIRDFGSGFDPEHSERICEPFFVADILHHSSGTGVNLAMAKVYAEHYNGKLKAKSDGPGQGSLFHICLNLAPIERLKTSEIYGDSIEELLQPGVTL